MKVLIIRFSSIGDIVLTTPVVRCLKKHPDSYRDPVEIHFLTKKSFLPVIKHNPYIAKIHVMESNVRECLPDLRKENFDYVIDLHHKIFRSAQVKRAIKAPSFSFNKLNVEKWLLVHLKINKLPDIHIVDRYFETVKKLGVTNDNLGLDYFISEEDKINTQTMFGIAPGNYHCLVVGGSYFTKRIPLNKLQDICTASDKQLIVLGGKEDSDTGVVLAREFPGKVFNACGKININQSASVIQQADKVITSDTGLMHIASAFKKDIYSLWGNTIPEFGMSPYLPGKNSKMLEVKGLSCRPCSKLGYAKCPKGHFKCMNDIDVKKIFS